MTLSAHNPSVVAETFGAIVLVDCNRPVVTNMTSFLNRGAVSGILRLVTERAPTSVCRGKGNVGANRPRPGPCLTTNRDRIDVIMGIVGPASDSRVGAVWMELRSMRRVDFERHLRSDQAPRQPWPRCEMDDPGRLGCFVPYFLRIGPHGRNGEA